MNRNYQANSQSGFTIIELSLAMAFVSLLLAAITMTVIQMSNIYTKGLTMRAVSEVGMAISRDMRDEIEAARPLEIGDADTNGLNYMRQFTSASSIVNPEGGRLCTGSYSYIWNLGKSFGNVDHVNKYDTGHDELIRLVKIPDNGAIYCSDPDKDIVFDRAAEMLNAGDRELALQSFHINAIQDSDNPQQVLYQISFELGTNDEDALDRITTLDTSCKPPADADSLEDFCAVNKFEFTARAGNAGGRR